MNTPVALSQSTGTLTKLSCPSCGAPFNPSCKCDYCGTIYAFNSQVVKKILPSNPEAQDVERQLKEAARKTAMAVDHDVEVSLFYRKDIIGASNKLKTLGLLSGQTW